MALELIAALCAAIGMAGIALLLRRLSGGRLPKWLMPVFAAAGLIGVTIILEYGWYDRIRSGLPAGVLVVEEQSTPSPLRPWTFAAPLVSRFVALDMRAAAAHPQMADLRLVPAYNFARWRNTETAMIVFDCAADRRVLLTEGAGFTPDGTLTGADWAAAPTGDVMQSAACTPATAG